MGTNSVIDSESSGDLQPCSPDDDDCNVYSGSGIVESLLGGIGSGTKATSTDDIVFVHRTDASGAAAEADSEKTTQPVSSPSSSSTPSSSVAPEKLSSTPTSTTTTSATTTSTTTTDSIVITVDMTETDLRKTAPPGPTPLIIVDKPAIAETKPSTASAAHPAKGDTGSGGGGVGGKGPYGGSVYEDEQYIAGGGGAGGAGDQRIDQLTMNIGLIVGIAAGIAVLLLILAFALFKYRSRNDRPGKVDDTKGYVYETCNTLPPTPVSLGPCKVAQQHQHQPSSSMAVGAGQLLPLPAVQSITVVPQAPPVQKRKDVKEWYV